MRCKKCLKNASINCCKIVEIIALPPSRNSILHILDLNLFSFYDTPWNFHYKFNAILNLFTVIEIVPFTSTMELGCNKVLFMSIKLIGKRKKNLGIRIC